MRKVGLTGSIAVGKSFVCEVFRELGCIVLDSDKVARDVVAPETAGLNLLVENFGVGILTSSRELDRKKLGAIVFSNERKRQLLNSLLHPLIFEAQVEWLERQEANAPDGIAIVDAALMIESGGYRRFEKLIVVWCDPTIQLKRLMMRDEVSEVEANRIISSQLPQEEKKNFADYLINTSGGFEAAKEETEAVYRELKRL
ncbi:MAG: dephospho-CoA kinase [Pyrinomonadaceae bacterium]